jgi:hypothetical protein
MPKVGCYGKFTLVVVRLLTIVVNYQYLCVLTMKTGISSIF